MNYLKPEVRVVSLLKGDRVGENCSLSGWVRTRRDSKAGFSFIELNDGSSLKGIQVVADKEIGNYESVIQKLTTGCSIRVEGTLVESQGKGQSVEVQASSIELIGGVEDPEKYPLSKKRHSLEFLRDVAHLRPRSNTIGAVARIRSRMSVATHQFFHDLGFVNVHTPIVTASDCEGAGEQFVVTTLPLDSVPTSTNDDGKKKVDHREDFFGRQAHLTVSGQLNGETYASALTNIYTFGPTFRAENSNTSRHLAEFWMIEPEMAFCDLEGDMGLAEDYIKHLFRTALDDCGDDLEFFNSFIDKGLLERLEKITTSEFERISYTEAISLLKNTKEKFEFPVSWGMDLQSEHERWLTEKHFQKPVIVHDYPKDIKAFYMRMNDDEKTVAAMDVLLPGVGEMIGGSQREERLDVLLKRMKELNLDPKDYWWYLDLRRYGSVPHAGFGLGFERAIQFVTGLPNIRDVIPFPRSPKSAEF